MAKYIVNVCRTSYGHRASRDEAKAKAIEEAYNIQFSEKDADYEASDVREI